MHIQTDEEYPVNQECTERKAAEAGMSCNVANPKWIRKQSLPYFTIWIFYYAWVIVFATWWTASPLTENTFGAGLRSVMHAVNLLSSAAFILLLRKEWFVRAARIGAALIIAGMSVYLAVSDPRVQTVSVLVVSVSLGLVNISILMPFVFALNNTEKLYAVIGSNALIGFLLLFWEQGGKDFLSSRDVLLLSFGLIVLTLAATVFFREDCLRNDVPVKEYNRPRMHFGAYMMLILSCVFGVLGKGVGKGILNVAAVGSDFPLMTIYHIGSLLGCLVYVIIYAFAGKCIYLTWNLAFGLLATGLLLNGFVFQAPELAVVFAFLFGIGNTIGMANMYYLLGVIGKKYDSLRYVRLSILFIGICGGVSGVLLGSFITNVHNTAVSVTASVGAAVAALLFLTLSPLLASLHYGDEWAKDSEKMEIDNEKLILFRKYRMSSREIEVCKLLLQGYTMRQISGILSLAYPTVNTYCTSIYRKININSRTELLQVFRDYANK